jgi:hypothetical protein
LKIHEREGHSQGTRRDSNVPQLVGHLWRQDLKVQKLLVHLERLDMNIPQVICIFTDCNSFRYFQAAEKQLETETGEIQLPTIQARLLQCFYLLSRSRKHQCWSIFGTVINLIFATSLHRKYGSPDSNGRPQDLILSECQKRVFWVAYVLDRYLSVTLGSPQMIHDEDIDQELPAVVDDNHLTPTSMIVAEHGCSMKATVCQIK